MISTVVRTQIRSAHTRAKKINVQLLHERYGRRLKGEIFPVSEGHMRLKLHPEGIAAYVRPNEPTPIPVLSATAAKNIRRDLQAQEKANAAAAELERAKLQSEKASVKDRQASINESRVQSLLDSLEFPSAEATAKPAQQNAAQSQTTEQTQSSGKQFDWQNDMVVNITNKN